MRRPGISLLRGRRDDVRSGSECHEREAGKTSLGRDGASIEACYAEGSEKAQAARR